MNNHLVSAPGRRGSALVTVLLFTFLLAAIVASILQWSLTERRMNVRSGYWFEARNAAEAVAEFGASQIATQFSNAASPPSFDPGGSSPLVLPASSFFPNGRGANIDGTANSTTHPTGVELIGGTAVTVPSSGALYYIDPTDPNNRLDPLVGQWVFRRDIQVLARATAAPTNKDKPVTSYVTQTVSVRGAPLFSHAIFYSNNDLEIFPGPTMNVYGPVHCNGNMFISSQGSSLTFNGPVSLTGNIYHAWSNANSAAEGSGGETLGQSPVSFLVSSSTSAGVTTYVTSSMNPSGTSTGWLDSTYGADNNVSGLSNLAALVTSTSDANFRKNALQTWKGNLQTGSMGIGVYNPVGFGEVVDSANHTPDPHVIIDPANGSLATSDPYYNAKSDVESQKMANKAGLYIQVDVTTPSSPVINLYGPAGSAPAGTSAANKGPNGGIKLVAPANLSNNVSNTTTPPLVKYLPFRKLKTVVTVTRSGSTYTTHTAYNVYDSTNTLVSTPTSPSDTTSGSGSTGSTTTYAVYSDTSTGSSYGYGLYDQRRGTSGGSDLTSTGVAAGDPGATDLVQIDMKALNSAVDSMIAGTLDANNSIKKADGTLWGRTPSGSTTPDWNGGVYVEVKTSASPASTPYISTDYPAALSNQTTSVRLVDGTVSNGSSLMPAYGTNGTGLTVVTNAPVYLLGNFNADGNTGTGNATTPDDGNSGAAGNASKESPVCVAGDAITLLSNSWSDTASLKNKNTAADTEYATALLVGLQATNNTDSSGGAHNLPRFLENWSGKTATMRGSLATLYSCKVATQPWSTQYYGAPNRNWGFDQIFKNGNYPPITPKVMSYRRILFTTLSQSAYFATRHTLWPTTFPYSDH
jgi:Tfp pilus assembly protein PilX